MSNNNTVNNNPGEWEGAWSDARVREHFSDSVLERCRECLRSAGYDDADRLEIMIRHAAGLAAKLRHTGRDPEYLFTLAASGIAETASKPPWRDVRRLRLLGLGADEADEGDAA